MNWQEYCISKKIDSDKFNADEPEKWELLKTIFEQVHPKSFTEQKKFLINDLRRKYLLSIPEQEKGGVKEKLLNPIPKIPPKNQE